MRLALALAAILASGPAWSATTALDPAKGAIVSNEVARSFEGFCSREGSGPIDGFWKPDAATLTKLEAALPNVFRAEADKHARAKLNVTDYYRQYAGFVQGKRRVVFVNAIYIPAFEWLKARTKQAGFDGSWQTFRSSGWCDGGTDFGVAFDPATNTLSGFSFDGLAGFADPPDWMEFP